MPAFTSITEYAFRFGPHHLCDNFASSLNTTVEIQTATLWIYLVHPERKKRTSNYLKYIHNNNHCDLNIQDRNGYL